MGMFYDNTRVTKMDFLVAFFIVALLCDFSVGVGAFVIGLRRISSFISTCVWCDYYEAYFSNSNANYYAFGLLQNTEVIEKLRLRNL